MEWSDIKSQESQQEDLVLNIANMNVDNVNYLDFDGFIKKPIGLVDSLNDETESEFMCNFPLKSPKKIFQVTFQAPTVEDIHPHQDSISTACCSCPAINENKMLDIDSTQLLDVPQLTQINQANNHMLKSMTISERMKLKTEKAKLIREKKSKRDEPNTLQQDTTIAINEEEEEMTNPTQYDSSHNNHSINEIVLKKTKRDSITSDDLILQTNNEKSLTKKEIKKIRNRVSAQRSRDRKKKEFDELQSYTVILKNEKNQLQSELEKRDKEMELIKSKIISLCGNCRNSFSCFNIEQDKNVSSSEINKQEFNIVDNSNQMVSLRRKYSFITGLFVVLCVIGTIVINTKNSNISAIDSKIPNRILKEKKTIPFLIVKDYSKKKNNQEIFLQKKRKEFLSKEYDTNEMKINVIHEEDDQQIQLNQDEDEIMNIETGEINIVESKEKQSTQVVPVSFYTEKQRDITSLFCKDFISANEQGYELFKQFFQKESIKRGNTNNDMRKTMTRSLNLRKDNVENNNYAKNNKKEIEEDKDCLINDNTTKNDMILHMIIPTQNNIHNSKTEKKAHDNSFYEVGCKIFEINKIYK